MILLPQVLCQSFNDQERLLCKPLVGLNLKLHACSMFRSVIEARDRWPPHASCDKDRSLRGEKWTHRCGDRRIVFWDNTNVDMPKASATVSSNKSLFRPDVGATSWQRVG
jgi:hypothetical protein